MAIENFKHSRYQAPRTIGFEKPWAFEYYNTKTQKSRYQFQCQCVVLSSVILYCVKSYLYSQNKSDWIPHPAGFIRHMNNNILENAEWKTRTCVVFCCQKGDRNFTVYPREHSSPQKYIMRMWIIACRYGRLLWIPSDMT